MKQTFTFNGKSSADYGLYLTGPGIYNSPEPDVESVSVPGLNGDILRNNALPGMRRFGNVDITYKAFFFNGLSDKTSAVKSWLLSPDGYCELSDTYDPSFFRLAACTSPLTFDADRRKGSAEFEITFSCKPQRFSNDGQESVSITKSGTAISNPFDFYSLPLITVYGSGEGVLTVGDRSVDIYSFKTYVDLDCETQNAKNASGYCNDTIFADDFPVLAPGNNTIKWSGGITSVNIIPRWWTL